VKAASRNLVLGNCIFRVVSEDREMLDAFEGLFNTSEGLDGKAHSETFRKDYNLEEIGDVVKLDDDVPFEEQSYSAINYVISNITALHPNSIWLDAATLRSPDGKLVLLVGGSFAGKTTLSLALALGHKWKILTEDITLLGVSNNRLVPLARPSCLRPGTREALSEAIGFAPQPQVLDQWYFNEELFCNKACDGKFELAVKLDKIDNAGQSKLEVSSVASGQIIREILPVSNLLRGDRGIDAMGQTMESASCFMFRGGTTAERMQAILQVSKNAESGKSGDAL